MAVSRLGSVFEVGRNMHLRLLFSSRLTSPLMQESPYKIVTRSISKSQRDKNIRIYWKTLGQFALVGFLAYNFVGPLQRWFKIGNVSRRERKRLEIREAKENEKKEQRSENIETFTDNDDVVNKSPRTSLLPTVNAAEIYGNPGKGYIPPTKRFNFIADTVEKAMPALVYIEIHDRHPFFGQDMPTSNGSGFIVSPDGLILTNAHVVANKRSIKVRLQDGRVVDGRVIAIDPVSDIAAIKIEVTDNLSVLKLGKSDDLRPGEWVIAMGSPLSLSNTITCGIVSRVHRGSGELGMRNKDMKYIQTDAAINFGNSGGPLVNLDGEAIGINTLKVTPGISFAIPIDYAKQFLVKLDEAQKTGTKRGREINLTPPRKYIGITMLTLTPSIIYELDQRMTDFPVVKSGVFVHSVTVGSPSHVAGVKPGDVIININGNDVKSASDVYDAVSKNKTLLVTVYRQRQQLKFKVIPEESNS